MGGEIEAQSATEAENRTCLRCDNPLRERLIPRFFCSPWHATQAAFAAVLCAFAAERFGLHFVLAVVRTVLHIAHLIGWVDR
ncbi:hypothetical protein OIB37_11710 [Streptomyces sp. NBC_00820]|uniref:hypothetical protein n=1 Tax=Streptomyces sp. NBC_00820 TaxID=2975842 RepID=UPI002ED52792|nr:hypothetical protein OIB37_11710 [Streptomyces sp. NBC_00820]